MFLPEALFPVYLDGAGRQILIRQPPVAKLPGIDKICLGDIDVGDVVAGDRVEDTRCDRSAYGIEGNSVAADGAVVDVGLVGAVDRRTGLCRNLPHSIAGNEVVPGP